MRSYPLLKIPTVADLSHVSDIMSVLHFIQVTKPIMSSRIIRSQVAETNDRIALAVLMFILNISAEPTKFIYNRGSISRKNLTITLSNDIYDSEIYKVIHPSSDLHASGILGIRKMISTPIHEFKKIWLVFSIENWIAMLSQKEFRLFFTSFYDYHRIMTSFIGNLGTSNVAGSQAQR